MYVSPGICNNIVGYAILVNTKPVDSVFHAL